METAKIIKAMQDLTTELLDIHGEEIVEAYGKAEKGKLSVGIAVTLTAAEAGVDVKVKIRGVKERIEGSVGAVVSAQESLPLDGVKVYRMEK